jgi:type IV pilus assembly protein PilY1
VLAKVSTGVGNTTTPSGFNHIAGYADNFSVDNTATTIYGGDLEGNLWRFDTSTATPTVRLLAGLKDASGKPQSITSRPELGLVAQKSGAITTNYRGVFVGTGRYLGPDDLVDPATLGLPYAYQQSIYGIKDRGVTYPNFRTGNVSPQTLIDNGTTRSATNGTVDWTVKDGWYVDLNPGNSSPGERVNLDPQLVQGTLLVVSNVPNNSACTIGGDSFIYQLDYKDGGYVNSAANSVAGIKFTGQITVGVVVVQLPNRTFKGIATGASGTKTPFDVKIAGGGGTARRISWRELIRR